MPGIPAHRNARQVRTPLARPRRSDGRASLGISRCVCLPSGLSFGLDLTLNLIGSFLNYELNKSSDIYSFYIYVRIVIFSFSKLIL